MSVSLLPMQEGTLPNQSGKSGSGDGDTRDGQVQFGMDYGKLKFNAASYLCFAPKHHYQSQPLTSTVM